MKYLMSAPVGVIMLVVFLCFGVPLLMSDIRRLHDVNSQTQPSTRPAQPNLSK